MEKNIAYKSYLIGYNESFQVGLYSVQEYIFRGFLNNKCSSLSFGILLS